MPDNQQFKPFKPEKFVTVTISKKEAVLLQKMRRNAFGTITVHKMNNVIVRMETKKSELIEEDEEIDL